MFISKDWHENVRQIVSAPYMKLCWIVVLVGISIILVFLYSLVAMSSRSERFIEQLMEEEGRKGTDEQDMEAIITEGKESQEHE